MKIGWADATLFAFCFLLLLLSLVHFLEADALRKENAALSAELGEVREGLEEAEGNLALQSNRIDGLKYEMGQGDSALGKRIDGVSMELSSTKGRVETLEGNFTEFREEYARLQGEYEGKVEEYNLLVGQVGEFENDLQEKMYWYTENADFGGKTKGFLSEIKSECVDGKVLNMPCVSFVLLERDFEYRSEGKDHIKSLVEFEKGKGGDCEDWSLFVKAIINEMAAEEGVEELLLVDFGESGYFEVFVEGLTTYYYSNGERVVDVGDVQVACFPVGGGYGHCVLVSSDVVFEPQDGSYISDAYWDGKDYLMENGGFIEVLIDNGDIKVNTGEKWISYAYFIEKIEEILGKE